MYIMYDCMCIFIQIQLRVHRYDNTACATSAYQRSYSETLWENFLSSQTCMLVSSSPKRGRGGAAHLRCFGLERGFAERCLCIRPHPQSRQRFDTWWGLELKFKWKPYFLPRLGYSDVLILQYYDVSSKMEWFVEAAWTRFWAPICCPATCHSADPEGSRCHCPISEWNRTPWGPRGNGPSTASAPSWVSHPAVKVDWCVWCEMEG